MMGFISKPLETEQITASKDLPTRWLHCPSRATQLLINRLSDPLWHHGQNAKWYDGPILWRELDCYPLIWFQTEAFTRLESSGLIVNHLLWPVSKWPSISLKINHRLHSFIPALWVSMAIECMPCKHRYLQTQRGSKVHINSHSFD